MTPQAPRPVVNGNLVSVSAIVLMLLSIAFNYFFNSQPARIRTLEMEQVRLEERMKSQEGDISEMKTTLKDIAADIKDIKAQRSFRSSRVDLSGSVPR